MPQPILQKVHVHSQKVHWQFRCSFDGVIIGASFSETTVCTLFINSIHRVGFLCEARITWSRAFLHKAHVFTSLILRMFWFMTHIYIHHSIVQNYYFWRLSEIGVLQIKIHTQPVKIFYIFWSSVRFCVETLDFKNFIASHRNPHTVDVIV